MRLTLRSLLAYMHGLLAPEDARLLEDKIRQSHLAQNTMQRIAANRGGASGGLPEGRGVADANLAAQYLDNTLSDEAVPQFERACFENDSQLVEVAAAHSILSDVLRQNPRVSDQLRAAVKQKVVAAVAAAGQTAAHAAGNGAATGAAPAPGPADASGAVRPLVPAAAAMREPAGAAIGAAAGSAVGAAAAVPPVGLTGVASAAGRAEGGLDLTDAQTNSVPEYLRDHGHGTATQVAAAAALLLALGGLVALSIGSVDKVRRLFEMRPVVVAGGGGPVDRPQAESAEDPVVAAAGDRNIGSSGDAEETSSIASSAAAPPAPIEVTGAAAAPPMPSPSSTPPTSTESDIIASDAAPPISDQIAIELADLPAVGAIAVSDAAPPAVVGSAAAPPMPAAEPGVDGPIAVASAAPPGVDVGSETAAQTQSQLSWQPETKDSSAAVVMAVSAEDRPAGGTAATGPLGEVDDPSLEAGDEQFGGPNVRLVNVADSLPLADRLIVPDAYRTEIRIQPGLKWVVASATDLQGLTGAEPKTAYAELRIGKGLLYGTADCDTLVLHAGGRRYKIVFPEPSSVASVSLRYAVPPGVPLAAASTDAPPYAEPVLTIAAAASKVVVQSSDSLTWSPAETLTEGQAVSWQGKEAAEVTQYEEAPWWYRTSIERPIDSGAAKDLALELQVAPPEATEPASASQAGDARTGGSAAPAAIAATPAPNLIDVLRATTQARRSETAALAARTLALLGVYDAVISRDGILNQPSSRPHRDLVVESLIQSIGIEPQRRNELAEVLRAYDPPHGERLLGLLTLPEPDVLQDVEAIQPWIDALSSAHLDERVLAIYQLVRITGRELGYQPDRVTRDALAQWKKYQRAGKIQWGSGSRFP